MTLELGRAVEEAIAAAREAGDVLRRDFHRDGGPRGHGDKADADLEAEGRIRERLMSAFAGFQYLGEETGRAGSSGAAPVWLVDPNDGTRDYLAGVRGSAVSIGLAHGGRPVLGVVYAFNYPDDRGVMFWWAEGLGPVRCDGRPATPALPDRLGAADVVLVSSKGDRDPEAHLRCSAPARYRAVPSIAHRLALVAAGEAAAATSLYAPGAWDYAAGHALVRGAGGVLVDESGQPIAYAEDGSSRSLRAFGASAPVAEALARRPWEEVRTGPWPAQRPARLMRGHAVADAALLSRAQGCLLGQVAGDSLGSLVEGDLSAELSARADGGPRRLEDGGRWGTLAGQATDDSEMALALARTLAASGRFDPEAVLAAYRRWYRSGPFDVGATTRAALNGYLMGDSQANGSLMRASPLALLLHRRSAEEIAEVARQDSALTHPHPVCRDAVAAFVIAAAYALRSGAGAGAAYEAALDWARRAPARPEVVEALEAAPRGAPTCDGAHVGFVLVALRNAFHELLRAPTLEDGVVASVRRGGDTDTNAAIAGALLGAVHGRDAVPAQWRQTVLSCRPHALRARHARPMEYWPTDVYELAELLLLADG